MQTSPKRFCLTMPRAPLTAATARANHAAACEAATLAYDAIGGDRCGPGETLVQRAIRLGTVDKYVAWSQARDRAACWAFVADELDRSAR